MTLQEKEKIRELLRRKREKLVRKVWDLEQLTGIDEPDCAVDKINREGAMQDNQILMESLSKTQAGLLKVDRALKKVDDRSFGTCSKCGSPIPIERLLIMPESDLCIACSRKQ